MTTTTTTKTTWPCLFQPAIGYFFISQSTFNSNPVPTETSVVERFCYLCLKTLGCLPACWEDGFSCKRTILGILNKTIMRSQLARENIWLVELQVLWESLGLVIIIISRITKKTFYRTKEISVPFL